MAFHIYLAKDPVLGPTHGQKTNKSSKIFYKSVDITGAAPAVPPPFDLVFLRSEIDGDYTPGASTGSVTGTRQQTDVDGNPVVDGLGNPVMEDIRTFSSSKVGKHHQVIIKLNNANLDSYKYDVVMDMGGGLGTKTWDPRVVPL